MRKRKGKPKTVFKAILNMALAMSIVLSSVAVPNVVKPITAHAKTYNTLGGGTGHNYYHFSYIYDPEGNGIALHIHTNSNNVVAMNYQNDFTCSRSFNQKLEMENPKCTHTLEAAIGDMSAATGRQIDVNGVLNDLRKQGYYIEDGVHHTPGIWRIKDGNGFRYLTYLDGGNSPSLNGTYKVGDTHATCTESGYELWSDGSHRNLTPALGHIWPKEWTDVGTHHEKKCQRNQYGCGHSLLDSKPHKYKQTNGYDYIDDRNDATHHRVCVDCGHIETDNHHFTKWEDDSTRPGWQIRHCEGCGYKTWRDVEPPKVMIYASKSGKWTAGDVKITVQAWDRGSGIKLIRLYRTNKYTKEVQQMERSRASLQQ